MQLVDQYLYEVPSTQSICQMQNRLRIDGYVVIILIGR